MKRQIALLLVLIMLPIVPAQADSYSLELAVPFGVAHMNGKSSVPLYSKASTSSKKTDMPNYQLSEILDTQTIGGAVWFKIKYYDDDDKAVIGFVNGTSYYQLSLAGLITVMSDVGNAIYLQKFANSISPFVGSSSTSSTRSSPVVSQADTTQSSRYTYVLNTSSKKFHLPSCSSVNDIKNKNRKDYTGSRESLISQGYSPCKKCNP